MSFPQNRDDSNGIVDDSRTSDDLSASHRHLYELSSFDMIVVFLAMAGVIAIYAAFHTISVSCFAASIGATVVVRISRSATVKNLALLFCAISYCCLIATTPSLAGPSFNYFWAVPFLFVLTGFRFVILLGVIIFIIVAHVIAFEVIGSSAVGNPFQDDSGVGLVLDVALVLAHLITGITIYSAFFVLGQAVWRFRRHPLESIERFPNVRSMEESAFSRLPMGMLLGKTFFMSEEQHLFILLRLAQHSDYRDVLLQLMRPTANEIDQNEESGLPEVSQIYTPTKPAVEENEHASPGSPIQSLRTAATRRLHYLRTARPPVLNPLRSPITNARPGIGNEQETEIQGLRQFLRSALMQLFLETHPNKKLCEILLDIRLFHCSRQQTEAALAAFVAKKATGRRSPRIYLKATSIRLWTSSDVRQRRGLPSSSQQLIVHIPDEEFRIFHAVSRHTLKHYVVSRQNIRRIKRIYEDFLEVGDELDVADTISHVLTRRSSFHNLVDHYTHIDQISTLRSAPSSQKGKSFNTPYHGSYSQYAMSSVAAATGLLNESGSSLDAASMINAVFMRRRSVAFLDDTRAAGTYPDTSIPPSLRVAASIYLNTLSAEEPTYLRRGASKKQKRKTAKDMPSFSSALFGHLETTYLIFKDVPSFPEAAPTSLSLQQIHAKVLCNFNKANDSIMKPSPDAHDIEIHISPPPLSSRMLKAMKRKLGLSSNVSADSSVSASQNQQRLSSSSVSTRKRSSNERSTIISNEGCHSSLRMDYRTMPKWQKFQASLQTLWNFKLISPTKFGGYMPNRTLLGAFTDSKIERWYLVWVASIQSVITMRLRWTYIILLTTQLVLLFIVSVLEYIAVRSEKNSMYNLLHLLASTFTHLVFLFIMVYTFFTSRRCEEDKFDTTTAHIVKLRYVFLSIVGVVISTESFFINTPALLSTPTSHEVCIISIKALKETALSISLLCFPLLCFCTEATMAAFIAVAVTLLFVVVPFISRFLELWPLLTITGKEAVGIDNVWSSYFVLFHHYAPCLLLQFVMARAIQGTLRRQFTRTSLLYLLYLDAMGPPYGEKMPSYETLQTRGWTGIESSLSIDSASEEISLSDENNFSHGSLNSESDND